MSVAMTSDVRDGESLGDLASNWIMVQALQGCLSKSEINIKNVISYIRHVHERNAWRAWAVSGSDGEPKVTRWNAPDFRQFIESPRPAGCQTPIHILRHMVRGTDVESTVEELLRGEPGAPEGNPGNPSPTPNPYGRAGKPEEPTNRNLITDSSFPSTIPLSPDVPRPKRVRDYSRESKQGTSTGYTLRRLSKTRPDLLEQVKAGDLSPTAAAVQAGLIDRSITIPDDPLKASRRLLKHFQGERLTALLTELANHAGFDLIPKA